MPPKPPKPAGYGKKDENKAWAKKLRNYASIAAVVGVVGAILLYAEYESQQDHTWAVTYERRCEACQTIITSGILTRSMIFQQEKKRMQEERAQALEANPEAELPPEEEPKIGSLVVLRYMCNEQQIDTLLANNRFTFGNGYATIEDPDFGPSLKKLCWFAMQNATMQHILKHMLEVPIQPTQKPTLVSLSQMHFDPVCVKSSGMCSTEGLEHGSMVDPQSEEPGQEEGAGAGAAPADEPVAADGEETHTEL
jgi:hypothetical protein